jgi:hypothetical protein
MLVPGARARCSRRSSIPSASARPESSPVVLAADGSLAIEGEVATVVSRNCSRARGMPYPAWSLMNQGLLMGTRMCERNLPGRFPLRP